MLSPTQEAILKAINAGHTTTRAIAQAAGLASNSNIARQLHQLAEMGQVVLREGPHGTIIDTGGAAYCAGWDAAAALAGNPEA
jgi:SOS-response transcriptional repressor LexA